MGLPLLLSTFSHDYFLHLAANMYVLHSICQPAVQSLGMEQFTAMYLISGVFGSFMSHLYKATLWRTTASLGSVSILLDITRILSQKGNLKKKYLLFQSAAVMGVLAYTCSQFPSLQFSLIFLPMFTFSSAQVLNCFKWIKFYFVIFPSEINYSFQFNFSKFKKNKRIV